MQDGDEEPAEEPLAWAVEEAEEAIEAQSILAPSLAASRLKTN